MNLQEAVVTEDIREQAEQLGYIVKQKAGTLELWRSGWHEIISSGDPWHVTSNSRMFSSSRPFWSRPFNTEAEALAELPEVLRNDARMKALDKYEMRITPWEDGREFSLRSDKLYLPSEQYESLDATLDAAERAAKEYDEKNERERLSRLASRLAAHQQTVPPEFHGINLDNFVAKSNILQQLGGIAPWQSALGMAQYYVSKFPTIEKKCLVLCGDRGTGKTSLAVAIAASLTVHDRSTQRGEQDFQCRYKTVTGAISADDSELIEPGLLLLDWSELQASGIGSQQLVERVEALSAHAVRRVLELRYAANLATVLIADCDQARLRRYLGPSAFEKLQQKSWEIVQLEKAKEITKCQAR